VVGGYDEYDGVETGRCLDESKSDEWSSNGSSSGDMCCMSCEMLCLDDSRVMGCDLESLEEVVEASSECCCSGDADDEPARRSKSSSLRLSFLR
jgi:hypothetical protein